MNGDSIGDLDTINYGDVEGFKIPKIKMPIIKVPKFTKGADGKVKVTMVNVDLNQKKKPPIIVPEPESNPMVGYALMGGVGLLIAKAFMII
jgi:hypothetical protein